MKLLALVITALTLTTSEAAWGTDDGKRVLFKNVDVLSLYHGKMTKGRRSSAVPQIECVNEGTAPCSAFHPKVVQCINKGSDGYDVQWECKTDMDNAFRFGDIDVSCEGYDYADDPYILHGSCGLKYSLDYTKEGLNENKRHDYYGNNDHSSSYHKDSYTGTKSKSTTWSIIADLIVYIGMGLMVYALYKTCTSGARHEGQTAYSTTNDDYPAGGGGGGGGYGWFGGSSAPPHSSSNTGYYDDASCRNRNARHGGTGAGGFWTGAATGGLLGYMFGNRGGNRGYGGGGGWGGGSSGWGGGGFSGSGRSSGSSGTRTASGFGGTSRR